MGHPPQHVAIIMDGNGRGARSRDLLAAALAQRMRDADSLTPLWPESGVPQPDAAFAFFARRERRFGKTSDQVVVNAHA